MMLMIYSYGVLMQSGTIDAQAMIMALAACLIAPLPYLNRYKLPNRLCNPPALVLIVTMAVGLQTHTASYLAFMRTRPWYTGSNGTSRYVSPYAVSASTISLFLP